MSVKITRVESARDMKRFIELHYDLYEGDPYDAPNLYFDEKRTLDRSRNAAFKFCEAEYFLAWKDGKVVGRTAAIINRKANEAWGQKRVRFGWIDFIDDREVSQALLDAVAEWGRAKGMEQIVGPLGFTDLDPEGMLTEGFDQLGTQATIYNYPYYPEHIEAQGGWTVDNNYIEYKLMVPEKMPEKYAKIGEMIQRRYNLHVRKLTKDAIFKEGYGQKIFEVINKTFGHLYGYSELSPEQISQYIDMYFPMADLNLVTVVEDWNTPDHRPVGVGITIPSLTRAFQKCRRGRLWPFGWWHVLRALKWHKTDVVDLLLVGVLPEYRAKGANSLLFTDLIPWYQRYGFKWGETHVEMLTNEKVQSQWQYLDNKIHKRRKCYIKELGVRS